MVVLRDVRLRSRHDTGHCRGNSSGQLVRICPSSQSREYMHTPILSAFHSPDFICPLSVVVVVKLYRNTPTGFE